MAINFNVNPYYDDYDEDKGFHRILFKPSVSVQARELTQLQTIMQKQVERMGNHFFEDGAMVIPGQIGIDTKVKAVKLTVNSVGATNLPVLFDGQNLIVEGLTTGVEALVLLGIAAEGADSPTLIVRFVKGGTDNTTTEFTVNETIQIKSTSTQFITVAADAVTDSSIASIQEGVYYAGKTFVKVLQQTIALEKYTSTPSYRVGLTLEENIVTAIDDSSLYDNAIGSPNETAPGADRYKIALTLSKLSLTSTLDQGFYELARIENGVINRTVNRTQYSVLERTLARRTFDESGNYTVNPFRIQVREHRNNNRGTWTASTAYKIGDVVAYEGNTYVALSEATTDSTPPTHISGEVTNGVAWLYSDSPLYNQGIYTPAQGGDESKLAIGIEPGKAYVQGYEIEKIATEYIPIPKARDTRSVTDEKLSTVIGNFVYVSNVNCTTASTFDISNFTEVELYDRITSAPRTAAGSKVGTAKVRGIYKHSGNATLSNAVFKLSLFDISVNEGKSLERNVKQFVATNFSADISGLNSDYALLTGTGTASASTTVTGTGTTFAEELVVGDYIYIDSLGELRRVTAVTSNYSITIDTAATFTGSRLFRAQLGLQEPEFTPAMFEFPFSVIKETSNPTYTIHKPLISAANVNGAITISGNTFNTAATLDDYVIINTTTGATFAGTEIRYPAPDTIFLYGLKPSDTYTVISPIIETASPRTKTATTTSLTITNSAIYSAFEISLNKTDVFAIDSVKLITDTGNINIGEWFDLDTGQRSTHYDVSKLIRKPSFPAPSGNIRIDFRYFDHGVGNYFSASSYVSYPYEKIPVFYGDDFVIRLSDVLDYRPVKNDNGVGFEQSYLPHRNFLSEFDFVHYLPRKDKISIDLRGNLFATTGASAVIAQDPNDPAVGMNLYKINLQPYTLTASDPSVTFEYIDNKRYTMRDIGDLEKRVQNIEYYTALSLLEQDTASMSIRDSFGLERFKNGFIVDNFEGHGVGDVSSPDYRCSINMENNELRPFYVMDNINLVEKTPSESDRISAAYQVTGDLVTLRYTHETLVDQKYASRVENVNPFAIATFNGQIDLNPPADEWFETEVRPEVIVNEEGNFDAVRTALESSGALGTVWNAWQTQWTGVPQTLSERRETAVLQSGIGTDFDQRFGIGRQVNPWAGPAAGSGVGVRTITLQTSATQFGQARTGVRTSVISRIDRRLVDDRIVSTATIPFIRSRRLTIVGRGFKPNTKLFSFFDDVDVSSFMTPATRVAYTPVSGTFNHEVNADTYGEDIDRAARRVAGDTESAFNKGDVIYVSTRSASNFTLSTSPATAVLSYKGAGNVFHLVNVKGSFLTSDTVTGTISSATGTLLAGGSAEAQGSNLITNTNGDIAAVFNIPNTSAVRFRTGTRELVFTDNAQNNRVLATTQGRTSYSATGTLQTRQATIAATRNAQIIREATLDTRTIVETTEGVGNDTGWYDPLAQTFLVDKKNGCFITKVDIFFSSKDANLPVTVEVRNTVNGYPGKRVMPFSRVTLLPEQVVTSTNGSAATTFTFKSPIFLEENGEYCIVLLSDSTEYRVWISQLGDDQVGSDRKISQQPYAGVLFKSQNASTWTADQLQDLKFKLYRAQFDTANVGSFAVVNETVPTRELPSSALEFNNNSSVITVTHPHHGMQNSANVVLSGFDGIYNIPAGNVNTKHKIGNVLTDTYTITVANVANQSATYVSGNIRATEDLVFDVMQPIVQFQNFTGTTVTFKANTAPATFFSGRSTTPVDVLANENNYFSTPQAIKSSPNENLTSGTGRKSFELRALMATTSDNLSPVIDLNRSSLIAIHNKIDDFDLADADFAHDTRNVITANVSISFSGNSIVTTEANAANILASIDIGKTIVITGAANPANNVSAVVSKVVNASGIANIFTYTSFTTESAGAPITIQQKERFIDERASENGSAASKYVTRQINLQNPSKFLKIMFAANVPNEANVDVYYRTLVVGSNEQLNKVNYTLVQPVSGIIKSQDPGLFNDVTYEIDNLPLFTSAAIKIVFRSTNSSQVPSIKDLRVIACP